MKRHTALQTSATVLLLVLLSCFFLNWRQAPQHSESPDTKVTTSENHAQSPGPESADLEPAAAAPASSPAGALAAANAESAKVIEQEPFPNRGPNFTVDAATGKAMVPAESPLVQEDVARILNNAGNDVSLAIRPTDTVGTPQELASSRATAADSLPSSPSGTGSAPPPSSTNTVVRPSYWATSYIGVGGAPVHEWIALQAYKTLASGPLKTELQQYLPTDDASAYYAADFPSAPEVPWTLVGPGSVIYKPTAWVGCGVGPASTALIEGTFEEDEPACYNGPDQEHSHYWDPDGGYNAGFYIPALGTANSALADAQDRFTQAVALYPATKPAAYYYLGRAIHLLADMSVPAHTLLDEHGAPWPIGSGPDDYENYTATDNNYKAITSAQSVMDSLREPPSAYLAQGDPDLTRLFYTLAKKAKDFDSDSVNGVSTEFGNGKYNHRDGEIHASDLQTVYQPNLEARAVGFTAALYELFWKRTHPAAGFPTIMSLSPSTLPTSSSPQLITIYGSNFKPAGDANASLLIFTDPANNRYLRTPSYATTTELRYGVTVLSADGTWSVVVTNIGQTASSPKTFTVAAPPPPSSGSIVVTMSPAAAVSAGAQWRVDGGSYRNSGDTAAGLTPGSHMVSFKTVAGYTTPGDHTVTITGGAVANDSGNYTAVTASTFTLTLNQGGSMGSLSASPSGTWNGSAYAYTAGSVVQLTASANPGYHFVGWGGDETGTANPTTITISANKSVTANFASGDPNMGTVIVTIQPPAAATAGVTWGWNATDYRASGTAVTTWPGTYILTVHPVDGWLGQSVLFATITAGQTSNYTATFTEDTTPGLLTVTLSPPDAVTSGAKWHVNGGSAQGNGATVSLPPGSGYTITFDSLPGWTAPPSQTVTVQRAQTMVVAGNYTPPAGKPVIVSLFPPVGAMSGGTLLTIKGVNFTTPATVLIGGKPATNVTVASATQITCFTPASSVYGSTNVIVQTAGGSSTNLNGFAYGMGSGNKIELVSSIGGSCYGVAVQGNYAYVGEGRNLLVVNVSAPSSPSQVGRVLLPGVVRSVALFGQYAYVADEEGGLQVVDVSIPSAPVVRGYSPTQGWADGIAIFGGRAYVADEGAGLQIFDLGDPVNPSLLSSTSCGNGYAVIVKASTSGVFAYLATYAGLAIIDVSNPLSPVLRGQTPVGNYGVYSIAMAGNFVFATSQGDIAIHMIDVTNPDAPVDSTPSAGGFGGCFPYAMTTANNLLYVATYSLSRGFLVFSISGATLTKIGQVNSVTSSGYNMVVSGNSAYIAGGRSGLKIADVTNPYNPTALASFTDSGTYGNYDSVAVTGNTLCADVYSSVLGGFGDLKIFDVSQPSKPALVAQLSGISENSQILAKNGIVYLIGNGYDAASMSTRIISVRTPNAPSLLATIPNSVLYNYQMALVGNTLYQVGETRSGSSSQARFAAIDVSNPSSPLVQCTKDWPSLGSWSYALSVAVNGARAVVGTAGDSYSLHILDLSNINTPVELGVLTNTEAKYITITPDGKYAYATDYNWPTTMRIVDIRNPNSPSIVTNFTIGSSGTKGLEIVGNELYAATAGGLYVFDISNQTSPVLTRSYIAWHISGIGVANDSVSQNGNIYLADGDGGVVALREQDIQQPNIYITNPSFSAFYTNSTPSLSLGGGADDNIGVTRVIWSNSRGGGGDAVGTDSWFVSAIALQPGTNQLTVTAFDQTGNSSTDSLTVGYQAPKQSQTITFPAVADHTFGDTPIPLVAAASSGLQVSFTVVSGAGSLANNMLTLTGAGSVTVRAAQPGNEQFYAAPAVEASFTVTKAGQSITFGLLTDKPVGTTPIALSATASSGLLIAFSIVSGPAVLNSNVVTLTGAGVVTVRASQPGNSNYTAATSVDRSFVVTKTAQFITFGPLSRQTLGDAPFPLMASATSGLTVSYSILSGPAVLSGKVVTVTNTGLVVVRANQPGDGVYAPAPPVDQSFVVAAGNNLITDQRRLANGKFWLVFAGDFARPYVVESSTNLTQWTPRVTNLVDSLGNLEFTDSSATNRARGFYRVKGQ